MLYTRDVHHSEPVCQRFLLEVAELSIGDLFKRMITKHFKEGFVIHGNKHVTAAQYKELRFVKGIGNCDSFYWGIT